MKNSITLITDGQIGQMAGCVEAASAECVTIALQQMRDDGELSKEQLQLALGRGSRLKQSIIPLYKQMLKTLSEEDILDWTGDLVIPAQPEFVVAEHFTKENQNIQFWYFGDSFRAWFLPVTEKEVGETTVKIGTLKVQAKLAQMTPELGENRILTASQLRWMLLQQPKGEKPNGKNRRLLTNGYANILRVLDKEGIERAVRADCYDGHGWYVNAYELEYDYRWGAGYQVVSSK